MRLHSDRLKFIKLCAKMGVMALLLHGLSGCDSDSNIESNAVNGGEETDSRTISLVSSGIDTAEFESYFRQALLDITEKKDQPALSPLFPTPQPELETQTSQTSKDAQSVSNTNVQVADVDEADLVKTDGEYLYVVEKKLVQMDDDVPGSIATEPEEPDQGRVLSTNTVLPANLSPPEFFKIENKIRILKVEDSPASAAEINQIDLNMGDRGFVEGLYLADSQIAVLASLPRTLDTGYYYWHASHNKNTQLDFYDISQPDIEVHKGTLSIEGQLLGSRRVNDHLMVVTRSTPVLDGFHWYPSNDAAFSEEEKQNNKNIIAALDMRSLIPEVSYTSPFSDSEGVVDHSIEGCLLPDINLQTAYIKVPEIVLMTKISLSNPDQIESLCVSVDTTGFFMSAETMYLFNQDYIDAQTQTEIHKFSLTAEDHSYRGSGVVPGSLGSQNPEYRLGEKEGFLIAITSDRISWRSSNLESPEHRLSVLKENEDLGTLEIVSQLPNASQPTPIGKPGEAIYGVRIMGDRAYIVTFRRIDPLYVIDIKNPSQPSIEGILEIPGVSEYLHPIGESLLLGIGRVTAFSGLKVSLFDVANIQKPSELQVITLGGNRTSSEVLWEPKSFTSLMVSDDHFRFTLPIAYFEAATGKATWQEEYLYSGLQLFEINGDLKTSDVILEEVGALKNNVNTSESNNGYTRSTRRSVLLNDSVHLIDGGKIWSANWDNPEVILGPQ